MIGTVKIRCSIKFTINKSTKEWILAFFVDIEGQVSRESDDIVSICSDDSESFMASAFCLAW
jgi:hypothetical protein